MIRFKQKISTKFIDIIITTIKNNFNFHSKCASFNRRCSPLCWTIYSCAVCFAVLVFHELTFSCALCAQWANLELEYLDRKREKTKRHGTHTEHQNDDGDDDGRRKKTSFHRQLLYIYIHIGQSAWIMSSH